MSCSRVARRKEKQREGKKGGPKARTDDDPAQHQDCDPLRDNLRAGAGNSLSASSSSSSKEPAPKGSKCAAPSASSSAVASSKSKPTLACRSQDGRVFDVELEVFRQWKMMQRVFFSGGLTLDEDGPKTSFEFPVLVRADVLEKVIDWCRKHIGCKDPVVRENPVTGERIWFKLTDYERRYFDVPVGELSELISAGNFLDVKALYLFGCQSMAALINHKTPEQIRELLGIEDDLTEQEKFEIQAEHELIRREDRARKSAIALFHEAAATKGKRGRRLH